MPEKLNKYLIPVSIVIAGIIIAGAFLYLNQNNNLSGQAAAERAINFINENKDTVAGGLTASLISVSEEANVYKINIKIGENEYDSYITKDGGFLFPIAYKLEEKTGEDSGSQTETQGEPSLSAQQLETLAKCLTEKGAKFYGAYWCSWCAQEKEIFGDAAKYLPYVECSEENSQEMTAQCKEIGITSYPTWEFNGEKSPGFKSLEDLINLSGCSL